jgi:hypothetical protein
MPLRGAGAGYSIIRSQIDTHMPALTEKELERKHAIAKKRKEDIKELAERGVVLWEGHTPKPGTILRIIDIAKDISKGKPRLEILSEIMDKFDITKKKAEQYYDAALCYLAPADLEEHQQRMATKLEAQYEELYKKAVENGQIKTARDILDSLAKIYQLTGGNRVQIAENADGEKVINIQFG